MPDPSYICDLYHSPRQRQILNPLSEARDGPRILMDTSQIYFRCATTGTPTFRIIEKDSFPEGQSLISKQFLKYLHCFFYLAKRVDLYDYLE